jgi:hypothetical protein
MFQKLNLNRKYIELASFEVNHAYYTAKNIPNLGFSPSEETAKFLRDYKLIAKQIDSKISILQEVINYEDTWKPRISIEGNKILSFYLNFNDKIFQTKSNIPFHATKDKKFGIVYKEPKSYNLEKLTIYNYISGSFPTHLFVNEKNINILCNNQLVYENGITRDEINNIDIKSGLYEINLNNDRKIEFLWSKEKIDADGFIGFEISQQMDQNYKMLIPSREIHWQYILNSKYLDNLDDCSIIDEKQIISFEAKNELTPQSNSATFVSISPILLKENYQNNLTLEKAGEKVLKLPFPELKNLTFDKEDVKKRVNKYFLTTYVDL